MIWSSDLTHWITSAIQFDPFRRRQIRWAHRVSLRTMVEADSLERQPRVLAVRGRTVAKVNSMGFMVRMCTCAQRKSHRGAFPTNHLGLERSCRLGRTSGEDRASPPGGQPDRQGLLRGGGSGRRGQYPPQAVAGTAGQPVLHIFSRLWVVRQSDHSAPALATPRSQKRFGPRIATRPKTASMVAPRWCCQVIGPLSKAMGFSSVPDGIARESGRR